MAKSPRYIALLLYLIFAFTPIHAIDKKDKKAATTNDLIHSYLDIVSFRHKILSQNVANLNTPGYKADEVEIPKTIDGLADRQKLRRKSISLATTSNKHMGGRNQSISKFATQKLKDPFEIKPNGNNVSLAQQVTKISQNQTAYDTALKAYSSSNSLVSTVLGK
jgi:flagellar basal-body rod protein FlgB